jgi:hypothetical protein
MDPMKRGMVALLLLMMLCPDAGTAPPDDFSRSAPEITEPDIRLTSPLLRKPTTADISRLEGAVGERKAEVLRRLGHPMQVFCRRKGESWVYQWGTEWAQVWVSDTGVVTGTALVDEPIRSTGVIVAPPPAPF